MKFRVMGALAATLFVNAAYGQQAGSAPAGSTCQPDAAQVRQLGASGAIYESLLGAFTVTNCSSVHTVLAKMANRRVSGGRWNKEAKASDLRNGAAERAQAHKDPQFESDLQAAVGMEKDDVRRLIVEASILDTYGKYDARDIVVGEAVAKLGAR